MKLLKNCCALVSVLSVLVLSVWSCKQIVDLLSLVVSSSLESMDRDAEQREVTTRRREQLVEKETGEVIVDSYYDNFNKDCRGQIYLTINPKTKTSSKWCRYGKNVFALYMDK